MVKRLSQYIESILIWQVKRLIKAHRPKIVAVTGSVGKTSTKSAIAHVLRAKYKVLAHSGNYNSAIGLPLAIFEQETPAWLANPFTWLGILLRNESAIRSAPTYEVWVLEMGAERKGEIAKFLEFIHPQIGVVTAVKNVHMDDGQFQSLEEILAEKWHVASGSQTALVNCEDDLLGRKAKEAKSQTYGIDSGIYHLSKLKFDSNGFRGTLTLASKDIQVHGQLIARHSLYALAAAAGVADQLEVEPAAIAAQFASFEPVSGRMNPLPGKHGSIVIDDSYNSSPDTVIAALDTLYSFPAGRRIAILGTMNELGTHAESGHTQVGEYAAKVDLLVTVGDLAGTKLVEAAKLAGLQDNKIRSFNNPYKAGEFVAANLKNGDVVLVKGSQNKVYTEEAAKHLLANREDRAKLVRQSSGWLERKKKAFQVK